MKLSQLWKTRSDESIYIVGSGPSLRLFPPEFFRNKTTICLNTAWKIIQYPNYILTIHPETLPTRVSERTKIITKVKANLTGREPYYFFKNNKDVTNFSNINDVNTLYVGRGIHTGGMDLAAKLGAKFVILVGCDMDSFGNQHHATTENTNFHGLPWQAVYREYYYNARHLRSLLEKKYMEIAFLSMNPFIGSFLNEDFEYQIKELGLKKFETPIDTSQYIRPGVDFTS